MACLQMQGLISSMRTGLDQYQSGSTTTYAFISPASTSPCTMPNATHGTRLSWAMGGRSMKGATYGTEEIPWQMGGQRNLTKICSFLSVIYHTLLHAHLTMHSSPMLMWTSTVYLMNLEYHGNTPKQCHLVMSSLTWVLFGTSQCAQLKFLQKRSANTLKRLRHGTPWQRYRNSTESYYIPPWSFQQDERTSPAWRPCSASSTTALSCHTPHPAIRLMSSGGGPNSSMLQPYPDPSQVPLPSRTFMPSQMPAPVLALASSLVGSGALGIYSQTGRQKGKTSDGQKQLASSSSYSPSCHPAAAILTSRSTEITREWWKAGGKVGAETNRPTWSSATFIPSWAPNRLLYTQDTCQAKKTQPTIPRKVYTPQHHSFCPSFPSPQNYMTSSSTLTLRGPSWDQKLTSMAHRPSYPSPVACSPKTSMQPSMRSLITVEKSSFPPAHRMDPEQCPWLVPLPPPTSKNHQ